MAEVFGPEQWVQLGGSTSKLRRRTLEEFSKANGKPINELFNLLKKGELDPYRAADNLVRMRLDQGRARGVVGMERGFIEHFYRSVEIPYKEDLYKLRVTRVPHVTESDPGSLNHEELTTLIGSVETTWQGLLSFLVSTGCRIGEAFTTRDRDIDLDKNPVQVKFSAGRTKTNKFRRSYVSSETVSLLKTISRTPEDLLFTFLKPTSFYNCLRTRLLKSGLTKPVQVGEKEQIVKWTVHPHTFRNINLAITKGAGYPPDWAEILGGHSMGTQQHYFDIDGEQERGKWLELVEPKLRFLANAKVSN